jgi:hypothetical protein
MAGKDQPLFGTRFTLEQEADSPSGRISEYKKRKFKCKQKKQILERYCVVGILAAAQAYGLIVKC